MGFEEIREKKKGLGSCAVSCGGSGGTLICLCVNHKINCEDKTDAEEF
jgi:hypothetical protein